MANPYRKDVYEYLIKEDGDFGGEIERLTKYLGYDKDHLKIILWMYIFKNLCKATLLI